MQDFVCSIPVPYVLRKVEGRMGLAECLRNLEMQDLQGSSRQTFPLGLVVLHSFKLFTSSQRVEEPSERNKGPLFSDEIEYKSNLRF